MAPTTVQKKVLLISPNIFMNSTLQKIIRREMELETEVCGLQNFLTFIKESSQPELQKVLLLIDFMGFDSEFLRWAIGEYHARNDAAIQRISAVYNVAREADVEKRMIRLGVQGIFYADYDFEMFKKGVASLLDGDIWFSRTILFECIREDCARVENGPTNGDCRAFPDSRNPLSWAEPSCLTPREEEILINISLGKSNAEIAKELYISPSTVKTHTYNIFQKIQVCNRIQAALWTVKHLKTKEDFQRSLSATQGSTKLSR